MGRHGSVPSITVLLPGCVGMLEAGGGELGGGVILLQDPEILRLSSYQDQGHEEAHLPST